MDAENKIISLAIKSLQEELDDVGLKQAEDFLKDKMKKNQQEIKEHINTLNQNECDEKDIVILHFILLGLGRNRVCSVLHKEKVGRKEVEKIRDLCGLRDSKTKKENEKAITALKWDTKVRKKRKDLINDETWEKIKEEYSNGASPMNIASKYNISGHIISMRLKTEGLFDELRSTFTKNKIAEEKIATIDNSFIVKLVEENKFEPATNLWRLAQVKYPWLLRRQFLDKLAELGLERTEEEIINLKTDKSRLTKGRETFELKQYMIDVIEETLGKFEEVQEKYKNAESEVFVELANTITKNNSLKVHLSGKQVQRIMTGKQSLSRSSSLQQDLFFAEIKKILPEEEIFEEYRFKGIPKIFDIYVESLGLAIDFNGDYWHSDEVLLKKVGVSAKEHHSKRVEYLKEKGIKLIYVWYSDWKEDKVKILELIKEREWEHPILNKYETEKDYKKNLKKNAMCEMKETLENLGFNYKIEGDSITILDLKKLN